MNKYKTLAALVATALLATAGAASAQQSLVNGGGASLPADLYKGQADSILPSNFSYAVTGSGTGKKAFLENKIALFIPTGTGNVHFAGSDSVLSQTEIDTYNATYNSATSTTKFGPLLQMPSVATSVTIPFNKAGSAVDLTVTQACGIFSGKITDWADTGTGRTGPIQVIYRGESSGTSELLTRFLTSACQPGDVAGTNLKLTNGAPAFSVQSTFANLFTTVPSNFVAAPATGGTALYNAVYAADGRIGYVGPDVIPNLQDATKVAKLKGYSPDEVSVAATLNTIAPPSTAADIANPAKWVPVFTNPSAGYPIAGYTNLVFGQCYRVALARNAIRDFLQNHYNVGATGNNDAAVRAHGFIPLTQDWREAVAANLVSSSATTGLSNANTCTTGVGR
ncbi:MULTISPECIES: PstS family phosphate ABC transporter substrate-binding protein [Stenotrophomonas]|uniref:Alkaline phosphatase n=1 Tax=Stenotrophomonas maltophilia TaxID=40324 RepID=A0AAD0BTU5_STEMA|nr:MULTISPECIES: substrate-binding domain-containing protein [Stenotrophomonas]AUI07888.1 alkaline phosphatase [Stenotrophomonas maltophilia]MBA2128246.1 alkaline phosphatase [Stenotrophomonas maltophilia]MBH1682724.1 substrate-binding domain-containing protein [Stenotrophomonas maltophilia]MBH1874012.1 substrate-binding domain-containing protein [Stenotrophomonas maltophilia]RIA32611.1 phosphate ABC transporter substrate-binding protein (PhoT family) [Stenotrophomonas sp. AG209]